MKRGLTLSAILTVIAVGLIFVSTNPSTAANKPATNPYLPYGSTPIDPPSATTTVLTIRAHGKVKSYRMADLLALTSATATINEPFVKKVQSFTVIPLAILFAQSGITAGQSIDTTALNDYIYSNTAGAFVKARGLLAIERNGAAIPYDQGGPIRIIFPNNSIWTKVLDPWNWSLASIVAH